MKKTKTKFFLRIVMCMGFLGLQFQVGVPIAQTADASVIITEIGAFESSGFEWVEIYNKSEAAVDLTGWSFYENETNHKLVEFQNDLIIDSGEYAIIADEGEKFLEATGFEGSIIDSSWTSLKESGEEIGLIDMDENNVELFTYIESPETSLQRIDTEVFEYGMSNWTPHGDSHSAGFENEFEEEIIEEAVYEIGSIIINELVSDPVSGEEEWIELFNDTAESILLDGWYLRDGSGGDHDLEGEIGGGEYLVIIDPKFSLNNSGDIVSIYSPSEEEIDSVVYGEWAGENFPVASDPNSLARGINNEFEVTETPTPGEANSISNSEEPLDEVDEIIAPEPIIDVVINELYINPIGSDSSEWIEILNNGEGAVNLLNYEIQDKEKVSYVFGDVNLQSGDITVVSKKQSGITLNNNRAETIRLYSDTGKLMDKVSYKKGVIEGFSLVRNEDEWVFSTVVTPGAVNIIDEPNQLPVIKSSCDKKVEIGDLYMCDVSDSYDPDGDPLVFVWELGEQIVVSDVFQYRFEQAEKVSLRLSVSDGESEVVKEYKVSVGDLEIEQKNNKTKEQKNNKTIDQKNNATFIEVGNVLNKEKGEKIKIQGVVVVPTGIYGKTIAYVNGLALALSSTGTWPELRIGDNIMLEGTLSKADGPYKLNVKKESVNIIEENVIISPKEININEINSKLINYLIGITGEIIEKERSCLSVADDSNEEVKVCFKKSTGIQSSLYKEGDTIEVAGILTQTKEGEFQVLPRMEGDISSKPHDPVIDDEIVLGEKIEVTPNNKTGVSRLYLFVGAATVLMAIAGVAIKSKLSK